MKDIKEKDPCPHMSQVENMQTPLKEELIDDGSVDYYYFRQDLPEIFNIELDVFSSVSDPNVRDRIKLYELFEKIKHNIVYDIHPEHFILNKYIKNKLNPEYEEVKKSLPSVCYNASFDGYKKLKHLKDIHNIMYLDIDCFKSKEEALEFKNNIVKKYDWIIACYRSLSKKDLHIIINVDKIRDNEDYNKKYEYISEHYFDNKLDLNAKSLTRYTVIPWDYDIYVNYSPSELKINDEFIEKGIRNTYITTSDNSISFEDYSNNDIEANLEDNKKGIRDVYNKEKVIRNGYTFLPQATLEDVANDAGRYEKLILRTEIPEEEFDDPNIPLHYPEGKDVIEINLFPYKHTFIEEGNRNNFIGALTIKLIILNTKRVEDLDEDLRKKILSFILNINRKVCSRPLPPKDVIKSFNSNCKHFIEGRIDIKKFYKKKKFFWSKYSTLSTNEKMSISHKITNRPTVEKSKQKIKDAIEKLKDSKLKVTQKNVAEESGLSLATVKKYRGYYNELTGKGNKKRKEIKSGENKAKKVDQNSSNPKKKKTINDLGSMNLEEAISSFESDSKNKPELIKDNNISESQKKSLFEEIFSRFYHILDENEKNQLYADFENKLAKLPEHEVKLLLLDISEINHSDHYFHKSSLIDDFYKLLTKNTNNME
jgi:hypothetical protein